jgi:ribose 5-phosphate isomerase RpiB
MRIAIINETSAADRNADIIRALEGRGHELLNCGMKKSGEQPELTYIHTGLLAATLLAAGKADFVVAGCGTGQGFLNSVLQYPGVVCGHLQTPLDAFLFARINAGNCVSLALNQGYGWAGDVNLRMLFDQLFTPESGCGFPGHRKDSQARSRSLIRDVSGATHRTMAEIIRCLPDEIVLPAFRYPGMAELLLAQPPSALESAIRGRLS